MMCVWMCVCLYVLSSLSDNLIQSSNNIDELLHTLFEYKYLMENQLSMQPIKHALKVEYHLNKTMDNNDIWWNE